MVGRHILIVGRVNVDEHYPVDKWHLGDLIAWVAQSALKYRPRICEVKFKDDRVSQEIAPHTVTPCEILCCSTINAGSTAGRCASNTCAVVISTETESGFITEDDTFQSVTLQVARGRQKSSRHMMWGWQAS
ncbi:hypothetical protein TNCV_4505941 [Trichonephila clavipes]|nr:hypothetical protein TNCV_4505941 [Trichonephila clavipes]